LAVSGEGRVVLHSDKEFSNIRRVLVIRNDKLGDFVLALPSFALIKQTLPQTEVLALVPEYTREIAEACPWIDRVLIDPQEGGPVRLARLLRSARPDAVITLFSTMRAGVAALAAGIPYRLAPATKLAQVWYNRRLVQRRSRSEKPEFEYNLDLVRRFLSDVGSPAQALIPRRPYLSVDELRLAQSREAFCRAHGIGEGQRLVFVHPGSGGSASNLSLEQYAELIRSLHSEGGEHVVVITSGPGERALAERLSTRIRDVRHVHHPSAGGLGKFVETIGFCDVFISGSTGPLHIAGALDRCTVGFYPRRRSSTARRWQTLSSEGRRLAFSPPEGAEETDMGAVDVRTAAALISERFLAAANAARA
jgi:ADP-heptose:LPS heptosyltransferase